MKVLKRHSSDCLSGLAPGKNGWEEAPTDKIWVELDKMQGGFCAYCECRLKRKHIEHFKTRTAYAKDTFNWNNLFGSCGDSSKKGGWNRCGIYKDNGAGKYNIDEIIKPDSDNPNSYLLFLTTGKVVARPELVGTALRKAEETIRVFNLNKDTTLFNSRKSAIKAIEDEITELYSMQEELGEDWSTFLEDAISNVNGEEFQTALEHAWSYNLAHS
ncbi:retron Ec78 anti-phage system effector HNH endonuclease PtuB [Vibrio harveyi]|uniref:retron Ec78 anti-phage system effector HNH endonuclease PtuB n=1 Tax=Vibrio harveyi TaxID=669 RepID=UPI001263AC1D|nr:retron Ec78 anti-phage system effector HNH endonuclease PtuB [Vibrio harveyi]QFQ78635.1 TIGR02646 family protein [Vibrio harveyi]